MILLDIGRVYWCMVYTRAWYLTTFGWRLEHSRFLGVWQMNI